jgi:NAD(P)-dependent dehydrogenase (short-subunit alcohol dehydrogenase family)
MTDLASFTGPINAAVFGASGGLGAAFVDRLAADPNVARVAACARRPAVSDDPMIAPVAFDYADPDGLEAAVEAAAGGAPLHLVIVATGLLHDGDGLRPERTWRALDADAIARAFAVNAAGPLLIARHALDRLATGEKAVFAALSARVGSISDNRLGGWHAYRMSKAALNQGLRTVAIELKRRNKTAIACGLHPGTVDTDLSAPFQANVPDGKLFTPAFSAERLLGVIDRLTPADSGAVFDWKGETIPA